MSSFGLDVQYKFRQNRGLLLGGLTALYFVFHCFCGDRNIYRYFALKNEIAQAQTVAKRYASQKEALQRKVRHLSGLSLDPDLLDERARIVLNMISDDEFIIISD